MSHMPKDFLYQTIHWYDISLKDLCEWGFKFTFKYVQYSWIVDTDTFSLHALVLHDGQTNFTTYQTPWMNNNKRDMKIINVYENTQCTSSIGNSIFNQWVDSDDTYKYFLLL